MICTYQDHADEDEPEVDSSSASKVPVEQQHHNLAIQQQTAAAAAAATPEQIIFPAKLHNMIDQVEKEGLSHVVGWAPHGRCFLVRNKEEFVNQILATWFRQSKFASFQRQLNLYGFKRITTGPDKGGYYHEYFLRGKLFLCHRIERIKIKGSKPGRIKAYADAEPDFYKMRPLPENDFSRTMKSVGASDDQRDAPPDAGSVPTMGDATGPIHHRQPDSATASVVAARVPIAPAAMITSPTTSQDNKVSKQGAAVDAGISEMNLNLSSLTDTHSIGGGRQMSFLSGPGLQPVSLARHSPPPNAPPQEDSKATDSVSSPHQDDIARRLASITGIPHRTSQAQGLGGGGSGGNTNLMNSMLTMEQRKQSEQRLSAFGGLLPTNNDDSSSSRHSATMPRTGSSQGIGSSMFGGGGGGVMSTNVHPMLQASGRTNLVNLRRNSSHIFDSASQTLAPASGSNNNSESDLRGSQQPLLQSFLSQPTLPQQLLMPTTATATATNQFSSSVITSNLFSGNASAFALPASASASVLQPPSQHQMLQLQVPSQQQQQQQQQQLTDTQMPMINLPNAMMLSQSLPTAEALALEDLFDHVDAATMAAAIEHANQGGNTSFNLGQHLLLQPSQPQPQQQQGIPMGGFAAGGTSSAADSATVTGILPQGLMQQGPAAAQSLLPGAHSSSAAANPFGDTAAPTATATGTTSTSGGTDEEGGSNSDHGLSTGI